MSGESDQIDAVIIWVDGDDPELKMIRQATWNKVKFDEPHTLASGADQTRFTDNDEIRYCIYSLLKFAPWLRNIYVVTDNQVPHFLHPEFRRQHNIHIVDHIEIFRDYEWALPTFNTRTIETALWRIPGLSEKFIYLNDDFVLTKDVSPEDFFEDEKTVLRGAWNSSHEYNDLRLKLNDMFSAFTKKVFGITRSMHTLLQIRSANLAGYSAEYFHIPHVPHPVKTVTLQKYFEEYPHHFEQNIGYAFRSTDQFSSIFLSSHLDIKNDEAIILDTDQYLMIHGEFDLPILLNQKLSKIKEGEVKFTCLQAMERFSNSEVNAIKETLDPLIFSDQAIIFFRDITASVHLEEHTSLSRSSLISHSHT